MDWMVWVDAILGLWEAMSCRLPSPAPMMMDCALAQRFFGGNPFVLSLGWSKQVVDCVVRGARCNHVIARSALEEADICHLSANAIISFVIDQVIDNRMLGQPLEL